jgi:small subunit ribosomal protein S20
LANSRSAIKRISIAERNRSRNVAIKSSVKTAVKKFEKTLDTGDLEASQVAFKNAVSALDKGVSKGVIHKNTAARKKSRLAAKINAAQASL